MTEKEFRGVILKTKNWVDMYPHSIYSIWKLYRCPCHRWWKLFYIFFELFSVDPEDGDLIAFGDTFNIENQLVRIDALSLFEEYCVAEGIYKEF